MVTKLEAYVSNEKGFYVVERHGQNKIYQFNVVIAS